MTVAASNQKMFKPEDLPKVGAAKSAELTLFGGEGVASLFKSDSQLHPELTVS